MRKYPECANKNETAKWTNKFTRKQETEAGFICISKELLVKFTTYLIRESYFTFGKQVRHIIRGFPTGTNAAPEMANLYLLAYELTYFERQTRQWHFLTIHHKMFIISYKRFIDDIFYLNDKHNDYLYKSSSQDGIFPRFLCDKGKTIDMPLQLSGNSGQEMNFLDVTVFIKSNTLLYKLYDKKESMYVTGKKSIRTPKLPKHYLKSSTKL